MKKIKNYLFVLMSLFVLPLLLTSCSNETVESTENLTKLSNTQATATATSWKSISNAPSGGWERVESEMTIPAGSILRLNGEESCLRGENCDDFIWLAEWINEEFDLNWSNFKQNATNIGNNQYEYKHSLDNGNIKYAFIFTDAYYPRCGHSWFDNADASLVEVKIYFSGEMVYSVDATYWCPDICNILSQSWINTEKTVTLKSELYINDGGYDTWLEYYVFHTMIDSFEYSVPGTVPAGAKIKMTNPTIFNGKNSDEFVQFISLFRDVTQNGQDFFEYLDDLDSELGIDSTMYTLSSNHDRVLISIPLLETANVETSIYFDVEISVGNNGDANACQIWSYMANVGYLTKFEIRIGQVVIASLDTNVGCWDGCCGYYEINAGLDEYDLAGTYTISGISDFNATSTIPEYCKYIFENSYSYMIDLQAPSLTGTNSFTVNVDSLLSQEEILSHVIATDDTDDNPQIVVESSTYKAEKKIGTFYINVHAVDEAGNVSPTYILTINVKDSTDPRMSSVEKSVGNNELLTEAQLLALFTATDNYYSSSDLTIEIISDAYTSKYKVPGKYEVIAMASDPSRNTINKSTYVTVFDATLPTISASSITTGNNKKLTEAELKALFTYSDDVTGTSNLKFEFASDNYSSNYNKLGSYQVTGKVTDEAGNYASATSTITVEDRTLPNIAGSNKNAVYTTLLSQAELKALFTISDDVTATEDLAITIIEDDYTANYNKLGSYSVKAEVVDENGNKNTATSTVKVLDNIKPMITGADINITNANILTEEQIRNYYKVNDAYDGELQFTLTWVKNYLETPSKVGVYSFTISASDSSNNPISKTFNLNVTDGIVPELWLDNYFIVVDTNTEVTQELLVAYAAASLCVAEADIVSVDGSFDNLEVGIYILSAKLADGTEKPIKLSIVEGAELPTDEDTKYQFDIKDIFKGEFWANYASGWTNNFAWPHWTTIGLAVLMLGALVITIRKRK